MLMAEPLLGCNLGYTELRLPVGRSRSPCREKVTSYSSVLSLEYPLTLSSSI